MKRQEAIQTVEGMDYYELKDMVIRSHTSTTHQWVEVYPDGTVSEVEEADNNTTHWIDYPNKAVADIYTISEAKCGCNCDICTMYQHFEEGDKEEFVKMYSEEDWEYCYENSLEGAIWDYSRDNDVDPYDIADEMAKAIEELDYGYFDDEK